MKRGEIYYISRRGALSTGSEIMKSRPGIIVSCNTLNDTAEVVEVVYLTTAPKKDLPTHVTIAATGVQSTALCEQIDHVSVRLIGDYCGTCSEEELQSINSALLWSLDIPMTLKQADVLYTRERACKEIAAIKAERDRYAKLVDILLGAKV